MARRNGWWVLPVVALTLAGCKGCGPFADDDDSSAGTVPPPGVGDLPGRTRVSPLPVQGTRAAGSSVWVINKGVRSSVAAAGDAAAWQGTVSLTEGDNALQFLAQQDGTDSALTATRTVTLDTTPPALPTVDAYTAELALGDSGTVQVTYTGTKAADGNLLVNGVEQSQRDGTTTWTFPWTYRQEGNVALRLQSADDLGNTSAEVLISVTLTSAVPAPVLNPVSSPTAETPQTLSGTKAAGTRVYLQHTTDGEELAVGQTTTSINWQYALDLTEGVNDFYLVARKDGQRSGQVHGQVVFLTPLRVNAVTSPTTTGSQRITGTKGAGALVLLRTGSNPPAPVVPADALTTWATTVNLQPGDNVLAFSASAPGTAEHTEEVEVTIRLEGGGPGAPTLDPVTSPTTEPTVQLCGTKESGAGITLRQDAGTASTAVAPNSATTFCITVNLAVGSNELCVAATDGTHTSAETCVSVERTAGALSVRILSPANGDAVHTTALPVEVEAVGGPGAGQQVTQVQVCLDTACADATAVAGQANRYRRTLDLNSVAPDSTHQVRATAHNGNGDTAQDSIQVVYGSPVTLVTSNTASGDSFGVKAVRDGQGVLHLFWTDDCIQYGIAACPESQAGNMPADIFHRALNGATWGPIQLISNADGDGESRDPDVAMDKDGNIAIVWVESGNISGKGSGRDIVYRKLTAGTGALGSIEVVTTTEVDEITPAVATSADGAVHVVYDGLTANSHHEVFYQRRGADGTWSTRLLVSDNDSAGQSRTPAVAADSTGCAHVVWQDDGGSLPGGSDADIYYRTVCGGALGTPILVSDSALDGQSREPAVTMATGNVLTIAWTDTTTLRGMGPNPGIWLRRYHDGVDADGYQLVSREVHAECFSPTVSLAPNGETVVVWGQRGDDPTAFESDIHYLVSVTGLFATPPQAAASLPGIALDPAAVVTAGNTLQVAWVDYATVDPGDRDRSPGDPDADILFMAIPLP